MSQPQSNRRWYRLTPDRAVLGLLAVEGLFLLSERFRWFAFNQHKGWTVLIAAATVAVTLLLLGLWFLAALVFRLRFQFSLLTLFVLTLVAAVPCSWLATEMQQAERQRAAVEAITGGSPVYDDEREVSNGFVYEDRFGPFGPTDQPNWFERIGVNFDFNIGGTRRRGRKTGSRSSGRISSKTRPPSAFSAVRMFTPNANFSNDCLNLAGFVLCRIRSPTPIWNSSMGSANSRS